MKYGVSGGQLLLILTNSRLVIAQVRWPQVSQQNRRDRTGFPLTDGCIQSSQGSVRGLCSATLTPLLAAFRSLLLELLTLLGCENGSEFQALLKTQLLGLLLERIELSLLLAELRLTGIAGPQLSQLGLSSFDLFAELFQLRFILLAETAELLALFRREIQLLPALCAIGAIAIGIGLGMGDGWNSESPQQAYQGQLLQESRHRESVGRVRNQPSL